MQELRELIKRSKELAAKVETAIAQLKLADDERELAELREQMTASDFWNDATLAADISRRAAELERHAAGWRELEKETRELGEILELGDASMAGQAASDLDRLEGEYAGREFELKLSGPYDKHSAIVSIHAGTGGTDAQDWAEMLLRMYLRFAEKAGFGTEVLDQSDGEQAGIKSVTIEVKGAYAFGRLKSEKGVHRLVRLSPFNADNLRQTSFALVEVLPELPETPELAIDPKDLRVDVYRAGGHGGQSVNTTDSAVRITHLPTGLVVAIQNERSQLQNKEKAMAVLRARLAELMEQQHRDRVSELKGAPQSIEWGSQIRSYVLHPYTMVKDHRTGAETSDAQKVLDGDIDRFIEAYLQQQIGK